MLLDNICWTNVLYQIPKGGEDLVLTQLTNNNNKNITSKLYKNKQIKLIGFYSFKFDKSQLHYSMFDKELLSIIRTLEHFSLHQIPNIQSYA